MSRAIQPSAGLSYRRPRACQRYLMVWRCVITRLTRPLGGAGQHFSKCQWTYETYTESVVEPALPLPYCWEAPSQNGSGAAYQDVLPSP